MPSEPIVILSVNGISSEVRRLYRRLRRDGYSKFEAHYVILGFLYPDDFTLVGTGVLLRLEQTERALVGLAGHLNGTLQEAVPPEEARRG